MTDRKQANAAARFRLYPTADQAVRLTAWAHTCRAIWNTALVQRIWAYESAQRVTLNYVTQGRDFTAARREHPWLQDLPADCGHRVLRQLDAAYANFWDRDNAAGFPRFKKKSQQPGVAFLGPTVRVRRVSRRIGQVRLPKLGWVRFRLSRQLDPASIRNATVKRDGLGWHVAFGVHLPDASGRPAAGESVGIDVGIACSVFVSSEHEPRQRPATLTPEEKTRATGLERRKARQIRYAKKHAGGRYSNRLRGTLASLASLKARQARRRADWNHKLTSDLAKNHGFIAVEDLKVSNMVRSAKGTVELPGKKVRQKAGLNRSISDQGWRQIRRQLEYKARRHGGVVVAVPAAGTSQTCRACGVRDATSRQGCGRLFACVHCGHTEHADRNAALNILDRGLSAAGRAGPDANGSGRSQSTRSRLDSATPRKSAVCVNQPSGSVIQPEGASRQSARADVNPVVQPHHDQTHEVSDA